MHVTRLHRPTRSDVQEYGTVWIVTVNDIPEYWIQIDKNGALWINLGDFYIATFKHLLYSDTFIQDCLRLFEINMAGDYAYNKIYEAHRAFFNQTFHGSNCGCEKMENCRCDQCTKRS